MKKVLICLILAFTVFATLSTVALANDDTVEKQILQIDGVEDVRVAFYKNYCFVAIKSKGVIQKSQCQKLRQQVIQIASNDGQRQVYVSCNPKLFFEIESLEKLSETERQKALEKLFDKISKIPVPLNKSK